MMLHSGSNEKVRVRRRWEQTAKLSLALRHGQNEFHRSVQRDVQKALEKRFRGRKLPKAVKQQIRRGVRS
jgi:hypothetical protein